MVRLLKDELCTIWWGGPKYGGVRSKITEEDHKKLRQQAPGTWGETEQINEHKILNKGTLSKWDLSGLIQDVLNIKAGRPLTYEFGEDLMVGHLRQIAELLEVEVPKKTNGRVLTNLILAKLRAH